MSGFMGPEKFTLLVSVDAPPWVDRDVRSSLCRLPGLSDDERRNVFATQEAAVSAGAKVFADMMLADERMDAEWLSVVPLASFSFG